MASLSEKEYGNLKDLYQQVYSSPEVEITEELIDEVVDELVEEFLEEGYDEEEVYSIVEEATDSYLDEAKVTFGHDTTARRESGAPVGARRRYGRRKAGEALKAAGEKVKGAVAGAQIAGSIAKDEARRAGRAATHAVTSAPDKARAAVDKKKQEAKKGIKGFIKRQAEKVVKRMSEEAIIEYLIDEGYADTAEQASVIMSNMSERWIEEISESSCGGSHGKKKKKMKEEVDNLEEGLPAALAIGAGLGAAGYAAHKALSGARQTGKEVRQGTYNSGKNTLADKISNRNRQMKELMNQSFEPEGDMVDEARRADKEGYARGTKENPERKDIPHGDPSQRSMLHSRLKRRANEMGRARRSSARNKAGGRTPVSKKEKAFLQAADRTARQVRNPNVPDTGKHKVGEELEALKATGLFTEQEIAKIAEQMTTQTQIPPVGDSLKPGKPSGAPKPPTLPVDKKKPEPKLGHGTPGFGYGAGTGH